jgi:hypothetical protein
MTPPERIYITVDAGTPPEQMRAVAALFDGTGKEAEVDDGYIRLSADTLPWIVQLIAPVKWIALVFGAGVAGKAGSDTWDAYRAGGWIGVRNFVMKVVRARGEDPNGTITIRDPTGPDVHLWVEVPDEALRELAELDWEAMTDGYLSWSAERREWTFLQANRAPHGLPAPRRATGS